MRAAAFCSTASDHTPDDGDPTLYVTLNAVRVTSDSKGGAEPVPITVVRGAPGEYILHAYRDGCPREATGRCEAKLTDVVDHTNRVRITPSPLEVRAGQAPAAAKAEAAVGERRVERRARAPKKKKKQLSLIHI